MKVSFPLENFLHCLFFFAPTFIEQLLHVCIEGWKNFHWSDPFGIDQDCTMLRRLEHKDQEATLFIQIKSISPLQKQVLS